MTEDERKKTEAEIELLEGWIADIESGAMSYTVVGNHHAIDDLVFLVRQKRARIRTSAPILDGRNPSRRSDALTG